MTQQPILVGSSYHPARGGHAPGDVREALVEAVAAYRDWASGTPEPTVELREQQTAINVICGLLWNCSDIMPDSLVQEVIDLGADLKSRTYAAAARFLKSQTAARG